MIYLKSLGNIDRIQVVGRLSAFTLFLAIFLFGAFGLTKYAIADENFKWVLASYVCVDVAQQVGRGHEDALGACRRGVGLVATQASLGVSPRQACLSGHKADQRALAAACRQGIRLNRGFFALSPAEEDYCERFKMHGPTIEWLDACIAGVNLALPKLYQGVEAAVADGRETGLGPLRMTSGKSSSYTGRDSGRDYQSLAKSVGTAGLNCHRSGSGQLRCE